MKPGRGLNSQQLMEFSLSPLLFRLLLPRCHAASPCPPPSPAKHTPSAAVIMSGAWQLSSHLIVHISQHVLPAADLNKGSAGWFWVSAVDGGSPCKVRSGAVGRWFSGWHLDSCPCDSSLALDVLFCVHVLYLQDCLAWLLCWLWRQALSPEGNLEQGLG